MALTSMIIGIISLIICFIGCFLFATLPGSIVSLCFSIIALSMGIISIVLGVKAKTLSVTTGRGKGFALTGLTLGIIAVALNTLELVASVIFIIIHCMLNSPDSTLNRLIDIVSKL